MSINLGQARRWGAPMLGVLLATLGLGALARHHATYLLFHTLVELFSVVVGMAIFSIGWSTRRMIGHGFFLFIALASLFIGVLDLLHLLAYKGMGVFPWDSKDIPTQYWVAARYVESLSYLTGAVLLACRRPVVIRWVAPAYLLVTAALIVSVVPFGVFPTALRDPGGLTPFKVISEYLIAAAFIGAGVIIYHRRAALDARVLGWLLAAIGLKVLSEIAFTLYGVDVYGTLNAVGHLLKVYATIALYLALIAASLEMPFETLYRTLGESENRNRALAEATFEGVAITGDDVILEANARFAQITGYTLEELRGMPVPTLVFPDDRDYVYLQRHAGYEQPYAHRMQRKDGTVIFVEAHGKGSTYHGRPVRVTALRDVSAQREAERLRDALLADVQRHAAEVEATFSAIADGVIVYGPQGEILRMNEEAERLTACIPEAYPLSNAECLLRPLERPDGTRYRTEETPVWRAWHDGVTTPAETMILVLPDRRYWLSVSAAPIRTNDGLTLGAVATLTDVTLLHELEAQHRIFLHMVSHDLRTPLAIIVGHIDLLRDHCHACADDRGAGFSVDAISRAARRMDVMIQDLVDAARIEGGQFHLKPQRLSLADYLPEFLQRSAAALATQRVQIEHPATLPAIEADPDRLERILINLLSNALKYSPPEAPVLVQAYPCEQQIAISVTDGGQGIPASDLPHLFERFYRATGARRAEGTGLGLYITRLLVEAHGGRIWVDSEEGRGCTFTLTLPAVTGNE